MRGVRGVEGAVAAVAGIAAAGEPPGDDAEVKNKEPGA